MQQPFSTMTNLQKITEIQRKLHAITQEMMGLIQKYDLDANTPLDVIPMAREKITDAQDYLRFLELSLEGRIYGDYGAMLQNEKTTPK